MTTHIVLILILIGVGLYVINRAIPMADSIRTILNAVVVVATLVWLVKVLHLG